MTHSDTLAEIFLDMSLLWVGFFFEEIIEENLEASMKFILANIFDYKALCRAKE